MARPKRAEKPDHKTTLRNSVRVYLEPELYAVVEAQALSNDRSMSAECKRAIREKFATGETRKVDNG